MKLDGIITALVTPFDKSGNVNIDKLQELIELQIKNGASGVVLLGTTGESPTVNERERKTIISAGIEAAAGKLTVIVGVGSNDTARAVEICKLTAVNGVDALLVLTPYYNKTNTEGMIKHFSQIADSARSPVIIYNVPSRTGCSVDIAALGVLSRHNNIIGIKEASGNISYAAKVSALTDDNFQMLCGNDDIILPMLSLGAVGAVSVASNIIAAELKEMTERFKIGQHEAAREIANKYLPFICALFEEVNPIPIKEAMNICGMNVGGVRLPLYKMSGGARKKLVDSMRLCGVCDGCGA